MALALRKPVTKRLALPWLSCPARYVATMLLKKARPTAWPGGHRDSMPREGLPGAAWCLVPSHRWKPWGREGLGTLDRLAEGRLDAPVLVHSHLTLLPHPHCRASYLLHLHPQAGADVAGQGSQGLQPLQVPGTGRPGVW